MTLTYQVSGGGNLDIDTRVKNPDGQLLFQQLHKDTGTYEFVAELDGRYTYCFSNDFSSVTDKTVRWVGARSLSDTASTCTVCCI